MKGGIMYGLQKEKGGKKFAFDLEKEIEANPQHGKNLVAKAEKRIHEIKQKLREGANEKDFDRLGTLLLGYTALQKVLKKVMHPPSVKK
jgi:hypothetical protein